jgi:hypothetical protein
MFELKSSTPVRNHAHGSRPIVFIFAVRYKIRERILLEYGMPCTFEIVVGLLFHIECCYSLINSTLFAMGDFCYHQTPKPYILLRVDLPKV